jgi:uncharacterized protein
MSEPDAGGQGSLSVEVIYALPEKAWRVPLKLPVGSTVADAIERSELKHAIRDLQVDDAHVGIFSRAVTLATVLREGDRVELYRPLLCDPKEVRRQRAAEGSAARGQAKR